jgi:catechol 2,3-dioxygenase-like lactoylglutathione lyase family enzyme
MEFGLPTGHGYFAPLVAEFGVGGGAHRLTSTVRRDIGSLVHRGQGVIVGIRKNGHVAVQRMDNVGIVVEDLAATIAFFRELGLELEGRAMIEGDWSGRVTGLRDQRVEIAMLRTPDGHSRLELSRFLAPPVVADHRNAPVNALGYLRVMFAVDDLADELGSALTEPLERIVDVVYGEHDP